MLLLGGALGISFVRAVLSCMLHAVAVLIPTADLSDA